MNEKPAQELSIEECESRIQALENSRYGLECSDERLFTNGNGNLAHYNAMGQELAILRNRMRQLQGDNR